MLLFILGKNLPDYVAFLEKNLPDCFAFFGGGGELTRLCHFFIFEKNLPDSVAFLFWKKTVRLLFLSWEKSEDIAAFLYLGKTARL